MISVYWLEMLNFPTGGRSLTKFKQTRDTSGSRHLFCDSRTHREVLSDHYYKLENAENQIFSLVYALLSSFRILIKICAEYEM